MIKAFQFLRGIGQFESVSAKNIELATVTVVYSENGRGKTTLAAVLRSLATGEPMRIAERRRLAADDQPHVVIDCTGDQSPAVFENGAWNRTYANVRVFDDFFIDENVHSGLAVEAQHRQNLHELILGADAVAMNQELQGLVKKIEEHNTELRVRERGVPADTRGPYPIDEFCGLSPRADIDEAIAEAERLFAAANELEAIRATGEIEAFALPAFDVAEIDRVLQLDLPALDTATLARVRDHMTTLGAGGEVWVADGMGRVTGEAGSQPIDFCPFCEQDLSTSPIIEHYRAFFSEDYASLKRTVEELYSSVSRKHGGDVPAGFERSVRVGVERKQFWSRFAEIANFEVDTAEIVRDWSAARDAVLALLAAKQGAPLERMRLPDETRELLVNYEAHRSKLDEVTREILKSNRAIRVTKKRAKADSSADVATDLARLRAVKARHEPATAALCREYLAERAAKADTERRRDEVKAELQQLRENVFPDYQTAINRYLQRFNADFCLDSVTFADTRGGPTCTYSVLINNEPVRVGAGDAPSGEPSFRTALSAGDRNTLALAFFFASLDQDTALAEKVVVTDDPISSMDDHRAVTTVQEIRRLSERCIQVIVLSHKKRFLCNLWEGSDSSDRAALQVTREGAGSTLRCWDVKQDAITEHDQRDSLLREYLSSSAGRPRSVAGSLRPHLEGFLRVASPRHFPAGSSLGDFRRVCRDRLGTSEQILGPEAVQELDKIVEYANRFHHDTNPAWETEAINDRELHGFVQRTLEFTRK